jgi:hypothetical protein
MALGHTTKVYGVNDAAAHKITSDVAGTAPGLGSKVDIPGVRTMKTTITMDTKILEGDNVVLSADSVLKSVAGSVEYARFGFDVMAALTSALATDAGTTPNQTVTMTITQTTAPQFVLVETQTLQVDYVGGDLHQKFWKCMPGSIPTGNMHEDYELQSFDFTSVPLLGTPSGTPATAWITYVANETAAAIS